MRARARAEGTSSLLDVPAVHLPPTGYKRFLRHRRAYLTIVKKERVFTSFDGRSRHPDGSQRRHGRT